MPIPALPDLRPYRAIRWGLLLFFTSLPFHRPPVTKALGPALALPELVFLGVGPLVLLAWWREHRQIPAAGRALVLVLAAGLAPSVLLAGDFRRAVVQFGVLIYVALIFQIALAAQTLGLRRQALEAVVLGSALASALGLFGMVLAWLGLPNLGLALDNPWLPSPRPRGPTESATMLAGVALVGLFAGRALARERGGSDARMQMANLLFVATLLMSQSRMVLAALAGVGAMIAFPPDVRVRWPRRLLGVVTLGAAAGMLALSLLFRVVPLGSRWPFIDTTLSKYRVCHEVAWAAFRDHPVTGVGLENFHRIFFRYYQPARHNPAYAGGAEPELGQPFDPHGTVQGYLAEGGLLGLATVVVLFAVLWRHYRRSPPESLGLLVSVTCALFFTDVLTERSTFAALGLLWSTTPLPPGGQGPDSRSPTLHIDGEPVDVLGAGPPPRPGGS